MHEWWKRYRPKRLKDVVGQDTAVEMLRSFFKSKSIPHALLFAGPSGCGKTSIARIVAYKLGCNRLRDISEINVADKKGVDTIRNIQMKAGLAAVGGAKMYILDEMQEMNKQAQNLILKPIEEAKPHVYYAFCTTNPSNLIETIHNRCTVVPIQRIPDRDIEKLLRKVMKLEGVTNVSDTVVEAIIEAVNGSARNSLVTLEKVAAIKKKVNQLKLVLSTDVKKQAFDLVKAIMGWDRQPKDWKRAAELINSIEEEPEVIRRIVLSCASGVVLKGGPFARQANAILEIFRDNWYDCGRSGLISCCFTVFASK